ncbi:MAG: DeoR family transcriptional regulator [Planctomycetes bacterium]|nr:DeoR family transcriptional regulator [Planctomycetota bacterium]
MAIKLTGKKLAEMDIIEDNALIILKNLEDGVLPYEDLTPQMRQVCVDYFNRQGEMSQEEIANRLHVSVRTIRYDLEAIERNYMNMLTVLDYKRIIGTFLHEARNLRQKAMAKEDYRLAWQIEVNMIEKFMELGFLKKPPEEMGVKDDNWTQYMTPEEERQLDDIIFKALERRNRKEIKRLTGKTEGEWFSENDGGNSEHETKPDFPNK